MAKTSTLKEFDKVLANDEDLKKTFEEKCRKIAEKKEAANDEELIVKAAKELGYELSIPELERMKAESEELDEVELEQVSGGIATDEYGHDAFCVVAWHCYVAAMHTESNSKVTSCFKDYRCEAINHNRN